MDIQEAREAFERRQAKALNMTYEGLKAHFDENSRLFGARYNTGSINEKEWNLWLESWQAAKAQSVQEGFVVLAIDDIERICRCLDDHAVYITYKASDALESIQKSMLEAQEPK